MPADLPSFAATIPANKIANNPGCSSSSSDEELVIADNGGWPSVVSVLETPDRRRMRKSLRSARRTVSLGQGSSPSSADSSSKFSISSPSTIKKRNANGGFCSISAAAFFNSPPSTKIMSSAQFSSPTMRTPSQSLAIHLSRSPLRSFFIKERCQQKGVGLDASPKSSQSSASPSSAISSYAQNENDQPVLKPLNLHNYIGIRFCGEQPEQMTRNQLMDGQTQEKKLTDENGFRNHQKMTKGRISQDSGFLDSSNCSLNLATIETPSKGIVINSSQHQPSCCSSSSISSSSCLFSNSSMSFINSNHSSSNSAHISPTNRSFLPPPLLLEFDHNSEYSLNSSSPFFHSPIPEQSFGPLEASVVHGILDDWDKLQPNLSENTSSNVALDNQSPQKTPGGDRKWNIRKPSPRSHNFERKLQILGRKRESPRKKERMGEEWWKNGKRRRKTIPSELFVEGLEQIYGKEWEEDGLMKMFPKLDNRQFKLMFGQTADQVETTKQAHEFLEGKNNKKSRNDQVIGHTKSAGLPKRLEDERRISLKEE